MTDGRLPDRARNTVLATTSALRVPRVFIGVFVGPGLTATTDPLCGFNLSPPTEHGQAHYDPISTLREAGQNP
jgi:hypothetical protein